MYHAKSNYHDATMYMINMPESDGVISLITIIPLCCKRVLSHYFLKNVFKSSKYCTKH